MSVENKQSGGDVGKHNDIDTDVEKRRQAHLDAFEKALDRVLARKTTRMKSYFKVPENDHLRTQWVDFVVMMDNGEPVYFHISGKVKKWSKRRPNIHYCSVLDPHTKQIRQSSFIQSWIEKELRQL